jgi:HPt (histidine-containing phosphotransfer) domain-containing protein
MIYKETENKTGIPNGTNEKVCDLNYLNELMGNKNNLIVGIMDAFLTQVPEELRCINEAVEKADFLSIKSYAHNMKSSVSIMGVAVLAPVLREMEALATECSTIERIIELNQLLNTICIRSIREIENEKKNYK